MADIDLSDLSWRAGFFRVRRKGRKGSILVSPTLKVWLVSLLLLSALHTEMKTLSGAKRWQSIPGIWLQQQHPILRYGTDPWAIFRAFLLKNVIFFLHHEWWSLQIRELNFYTTPEKLWLREESFPTLDGLGSTRTPVPSSQAACRKPSSGYKARNA